MMAKGIIYVMTTVVPGLIKIGKTGTENFESRMYNLERNGYSNVVGLKRKFAIEVEDYDEKEQLLDDIFNKSRVQNTELFALDADLVIQLLSSFEGRQVYPEQQTKTEVFEAVTRARSDRENRAMLPDGDYTLNDKRYKATMRVENGVFTVLAGASCSIEEAEWVPQARRNAPIVNGILQADVACNSPSTAGFVVLGRQTNGWVTWLDSDGNKIDTYR